MLVLGQGVLGSWFSRENTIFTGSKG